MPDRRGTPRRECAAAQGSASVSATRFAFWSSSSIALLSSDSSASTSSAFSASLAWERRSSSARARSRRASSSSALLRESSALIDRPSWHPLPHDPSQNPVHQPRSIVGCVPLCQIDCFVDCHLVRNLLPVQLVQGDAKDVALDRAEPVGRPPLSRLGDPAVVFRSLRGNGLSRLACERIDLALVERCKRLAGDVPLVEEEQCGPTRGAATAHSTSSTETSTLPIRTAHMVASASATRC